MLSRRTLYTCAWIAAILVIAGIVGVAQTRADLSRSVTIVEGTPVELVCPAWSTSPAPAAVVVHGFSGSRQVMYGIGQTLARNGMCAAILDLPGHGSNLSHMGVSAAPGRAAGLDAAVASAVKFLRSRPGVAPGRIALVGHSMGAGIVVRYAAQHPDIAATVSISAAGAKTGPQADRPRNLLLVVGAWEFPTIIRGAVEALQSAYPRGVAGTTYGRPEDGTARRLVIVPHVEHIGVVFSSDVVVEIVHWIGQATGVPMARTPVTAVPMAWVWIIYAGVAVGFLPLVGLLFGPLVAGGAEPPAEAAWTWRVRLPIMLAVPLLAAVAARFYPTPWVPLMTADYLTSFFFTAGIVVLVLLVAAGRSLLVGMLTSGHVWRAAAVTLYAMGGLAITAQYTWLDLQLVGQRRWIALAVFPVWLAYFMADEILHSDLAGGRRAAWYVSGKLVVVAVLLGSAYLGGAPFLLLLLVPALVPLFLLHAYYSHELHRVGAGALPAALLHATIFAWIMAAVFPLA